MKFAELIKNTMHQQMSVGIWNIQPSAGWSFHWHDYCTIDVIMEGDAIHFTTLGQQEITKGYMHLVMPSDIHFIGSLEGCRLASVRFAADLLPDSVKELLSAPNKSAKLDDNSYEAVMGIIKAMGSYGHDQLLGIRLLESLLLILQNNISADGKAVPDNMKKVMNFLDINFREDPSLERTAAVGSYNPSYFSALFKKTTGYTYSEYLNSKKLGYACAIMKNKDLTLTDIALSSGFASVAALGRAFKSVMGETPKEYRKKLL